MRAPLLLAEAAGDLLAHGYLSDASEAYYLASLHAQTPEGRAVLIEQSRLAREGRSEPDGCVMEARFSS
jgi:hypothetical protein